MTYVPGIPKSGQSLGSSRTQVLNNFTNYNNTISKNHVAPNSAGEGKHTFVEMPVQGLTPSTLAGEGGLFTKSLSTDPTKSILYYQRDANTTVNQPVLPMATACFIVNAGAVGNIVMKYNITSIVKTGLDGQYTITMAFPLPFSAGIAEYGVLATFTGVPNTTAVSVYGQNLMAQTFTIETKNAAGSRENQTGRITFSVIQ